MWVRGLKPVNDGIILTTNRVAPHVGAWIETQGFGHLAQLVQSHPMWVRGLKQVGYVANLWLFTSHPMWVRGLKLSSLKSSVVNVESHPMWVRGLKQQPLYVLPYQPVVAPHVGAWIETPITTSSIVYVTVAPHVGAWIETKERRLSLLAYGKSHPMWVRGLKPASRLSEDYQRPSHPMWVRGLKLCVSSILLRRLWSHPMWVRGLKLFNVVDYGTKSRVAPHVGAWIETR